MASKIEHSMSYPFSTLRLWEIIAAERYWVDLIEAINAGHAVLESFKATSDEVTLALKQVIPEDQLPSVITKIRPGDMEIPRHSTFRLADGVINADILATVSGASAKILGTQRALGDPSTVTLDGEVKVGIPLIGGKIEKTIANELVALFDRERDETVTWEANNR